MDLFKNIWDFIGGEQIKAIGAVLVASAALWRFFRSENQKQARNASSLIERFSKNGMNLAAMRMIDWEDGGFHVRIGGVWKEIKYDSSVFTKALRTTDTFNFGEDEQIIRDVMDHFLSDLERINFLIDRKVLRKTDFDAFFYYWRGKIGVQNLAQAPEADQRIKALWKYIQYYQFRRIPDLFAKYSLKIPGPQDF